MVMDATPSPQSVGREFVRQYYTLLNKSPNHLHRFYNNHSSFVHGGLEPHNREATLVIGQKQIHNKIQQLNFRDCHAKISQVDSQVTLGNGVVVQVTGELSNDGQPMRRFTQTFVLAFQSPRKYYVHNDIFRYQDVYSDDEADVDSGRSENDDEQENEPAVVGDSSSTALGQQPAQIFYPLGVPPAAQNVTMQPFTQQPQINGVIVHDEISAPSNPLLTPTQTALTQQPQPASTTLSVVDPINANANVNVTSNISLVDLKDTSIQTSLNMSSEIDTTPTMEQNPAEEQDHKKDEYKANSEKNEQSKETDSVPSRSIAHPEPKTYANLVKSGGGVSGMSFASAMSSSPASNLGGSSTRQSTLSPPPGKFHQDNSLRSERESSGLSQRSSNGPRPLRERRSSNTNNQTHYGDNHQLFLGNLPHHATEEDLRAMFCKYGTVVDLRIHSKPGQKIPGGRAPPNYGFITFEDPESAQNCLADQNICYPDSADGQKLNIEEKKTRLRGPDGGTDRGNDRRIGGSNMPGNGGGASRSGGLGGLGRGPNPGGMMRSGGPGGPRGNGGGGSGRGGFNRSDRALISRGGGGPGGNLGGTGNSNSGPGNNSYGRR